MNFTTVVTLFPLSYLHVAAVSGSEWEFNSRLGSASCDNSTITKVILSTGWLKTWEKYYSFQTKAILDRTVEFLSDDPQLKFVWAEVIYFSKWYNEASTESKKKVKR